MNDRINSLQLTHASECSVAINGTVYTRVIIRSVKNISAVFLHVGIRYRYIQLYAHMHQIMFVMHRVAFCITISLLFNALSDFTAELVLCSQALVKFVEK